MAADAVDLGSCRALFLDGCGDRAGDRIDLTYRLLDLADGGDRPFGRGTHLVDMAGDLLGRGGGLCRERLHFRGDHGEAFARIARTCRLDCRVQCQQIGLAGDLSDHVGDRSDAPNLVVQRRYRAARLVGGCNRTGDHRGGVAHLGADLADRAGELPG